jgi:phosphatidylglycerophosphatase A
MNSVALHRARKSPRLSLPISHWSAFIATCGSVGYWPGFGYPVFSGALITTLATPFILWPAYTWGGPLLVLAICLAATLIGTAALIDIQQKGQPSDHDARPVVIDEFAGTALTLALGWPWLHYFIGTASPVVNILGADGAIAVHLLYIGLLFRFFDIFKPWPASWVDVHWHTPFSVIGDDLVAAFYAALVAPLPFILLQ